MFRHLFLIRQVVISSRASRASIGACCSAAFFLSPHLGIDGRCFHISFLRSFQNLQWTKRCSTSKDHQGACHSSQSPTKICKSTRCAPRQSISYLATAFPLLRGSSYDPTSGYESPSESTASSRATAEPTKRSTPWSACDTGPDFRDGTDHQTGHSRCGRLDRPQGGPTDRR